MTNYAISRVATFFAFFALFVAMIGFIGAFMSTNSFFTACAVVGVIVVSVCQFFIIEG